MNNQSNIDIGDNIKGKLKLLFLCFIAVLLLFGVDCLPEFATDTYSTLKHSAWRHMLYDNGRLINAGVYYFFERYLNLSDTAIYSLSYVLGIIFLTGALFIVSKRIEEYGINIWYAIAIAIAIVINIYFIEYFLFIETGLFMFGVLFVTLAFNSTLNYIQGGGIRNLLIAETYLVAVVFIYQIYLGLYVILCCPFIIKHSINLKGFIKNNVLVTVEYTTAMIIGLITTKYILGSSRLPEKLDYWTIITNTLYKIKQYFWNSGYIIPQNLFAAVCIGLVFLNVYIAIKSKRYIIVLQIVYLVVGVLLISFAPYFLGTTVDFTPRIMYPYASLIGVLLINIFMNTDMTEYFNRKKIVYFLFLFAFLFQMVSFNKIFIDRYKCNQTDKYVCSMIMDRIKNYEDETGIIIGTICIYEDASKTWSYPDLNKSQLILRSFDTTWSDVNSIIFYSGRDFVKGEPKDSYSEFFREKDWNTFSDEQLIFEGDTLHLCIY